MYTDQNVLWDDIPDYEGRYQISNTGSVRSKDRTEISIDGKRRRFRGRVFKPKKHKSGYYFVELSKNGQRKNHYVHRLVAAAFVSNPDNKPQVNHINGRKTDNKASNLEWVLLQENIDHAWQTGLYKLNPMFKARTLHVIDTDRGLTYKSLKEAAGYYGVNYSTLRSQLKRGICKLPLRIE